MNWYVAIAVVLLSASCLKAQDPGLFKSKSQKEVLADVVNKKAYLIDVRTPEEFAGGHLQHALNIDFLNPDFKERIGKLDKGKPVYLYCRSGNRSGKASDTLRLIGFSAANNLGGFEELKNLGFPAINQRLTTAKK